MLDLLDSFIEKQYVTMKMVRLKCVCWVEFKTTYKAYAHWLKSCWCLARKPPLMITHWMTWTRFYRVYENISNRTSNPWKNHNIYFHKWITNSWKSFEEFRDDMYDLYLAHVSLHWEKNTTIDRINSDKGYYKDNCRWATYEVQQNNTTRNKYITYKDKTQSLSLWCKELWLPYQRVYLRLTKLGWPVEKAFIL